MKSAGSFGQNLRFLRRNARDHLHGGGLSQARLADLLSETCGITYSRAAISDWERGKGQIHKDDRHVLVSMIKVLHIAGGLRSADEANEWLESGNYRPLNAVERATVSSDWLRPRGTDSFVSQLFMAPTLPGHAVVGRDSELGSLQSVLMSRNDLNVAAVYGMGGVGKTTVAIATAYALHRHFSDGVLWGDLRLSSADSVLESWAQAFGVDISGLSDFSSRAARMRGLLAGKNVLLILDDVVVSDGAVQLLPPEHAPCSVLVTTRSAEVASRLTAREHDQMISLTPMTRENSLKILDTLIGSDKVANESNSADCIAESLGDLPLALHIAAALLKDTGLTIGELEALFANRATRLDHLQRDHRFTIRIAFEQSLAMLDHSTRDAFAAVSLFSGRKFTVNDFAACFDVQPTHAVVLLTQLCRRSLLQRIDPITRCYQQHTLLSAFAAEQLSAEDESHIRFARHFLLEARRELVDARASQPRWSHIMAGMESAYKHKHTDLVVAYFDLLQTQWERHGRYSEARQAGIWALEIGENANNQAFMASVLFCLAKACLEQSAYAEAKHNFHRTAHLFTALGDELGLGHVYFHLSRVFIDQGERDSAEAAIQKAWRHYQNAENLQGMGNTLYRRAGIHVSRDQFHKAKTVLQDALSVQTRIDDKRGLFRSHALAIRVYSELNELETAQQHSLRAEQLSIELNERPEMALFYYNYAGFCYKTADLPAAQTAAKRALQLFREMADITSEANTLNALAAIEIASNKENPDRRQFEDGIRWCLHGITLCDQTEYQLGKAALLQSLGILHRQSGNPTTALRAWQIGEAIAQSLGYELLQRRLQQLQQEVLAVST